MAYQERKQQRTPPRKKKRDASLWFCWCFGAVVCVTFGLASFLMLSAGHFESFSSVAAWGDEDGENTNFVKSNLITVEITDLEPVKNQNSVQEINKPDLLFAQSNVNLDEFGPLPKYLSDYESIVLNELDNGKTIVLDDEDEEAQTANLNSDGQVTVKKATEKIIVLSETGEFWREHIVRPGETLSDIVLAYGGLTADDILKANGLKNANKLVAGQLLLIPNEADKVDETLDEVRTRQMRVAAVREKVEPLKIKSYVVAPGDSLWSISNSQNIELDTLVGSNNFKSSARLRPGAVLRIPNQDGIFYTMKKGETIENVCKRYGVSMNKLKQVNAAKNVASLKNGEEIFLPGARPEGLVEPKEEVGNC